MERGKNSRKEDKRDKERRKKNSYHILSVKFKLVSGAIRSHNSKKYNVFLWSPVTRTESLQNTQTKQKKQILKNMNVFRNKKSHYASNYNKSPPLKNIWTKRLQRCLSSDFPLILSSLSPNRGGRCFISKSKLLSDAGLKHVDKKNKSVTRSVIRREKLEKEVKWERGGREEEK